MKSLGWFIAGTLSPAIVLIFFQRWARWREGTYLGYVKMGRTRYGQ